MAGTLDAITSGGRLLNVFPAATGKAQHQLYRAVLMVQSMLRSKMSTGALIYSGMKLFSKYSNLCDHSTLTLQADILSHNRTLRSTARQ